ncbi:MAG: sugar phosphate isomerase/epimerase [Candidatus Hydrogenedentes bacterium]|nr:sugar phosphate isomerase/epimerase [Candidatus Hydrogenedentota bacterium]
MFFSGISDEAGKSLATQIQAHQELGWKHIELRMVDGHNITQLPASDFARTHDEIQAADLQVSCFGSAIANWARPITCDAQIDIDDLQQAIPRMHQMKTQLIRVMSYPNAKDHPLSETAWRRESIRRIKELARIAEDNGIILAHENCSGWGGLSAENGNILLGEVDSPALKVVYDTGNPVTYGQNAWEYYQAVCKDIVYVHVKDAKANPHGEEQYCLCGDGDGYVRETLQDLLINGYTGGVSIEPHLAAVIHTGQKADTEGHLYESYTAYGRRLMELVHEAKASMVR